MDQTEERNLAELRELVEKHPFNYTRCLKSKGFMGRYPDRTELLEWVLKKTEKMCDDSFEYTLKTRVYWVMNGIESWDDDRVKCCVCGKPIKHWNVTNIDFSYKKTCSKECDRELFSKTNKERMKEKYGVENAFQLPDVLQSLKERKARKIATRQ